MPHSEESNYYVLPVLSGYRRRRTSEQSMRYGGAFYYPNLSNFSAEDTEDSMEGPKLEDVPERGEYEEFEELPAPDERLTPSRVRNYLEVRVRKMATTYSVNARKNALEDIIQISEQYYSQLAWEKQEIRRKQTGEK